MDALYALRPSALYRAFASQGFAFWMASLYLFFEYVRPQAILSFLDAYPYWARTFIVLALIGWLLDPNRRFVWTWASTGISVFLGVVILASATAYWPDVSWSNFMNFFNWAVIFFVLTQTVTTRVRFYILLLIFLLASFKLSQHGARAWAGMGFGFSDWGLRGPRGFFENPGELAIQMVVFAPIALFFSLAVASYLKRWQLYLLYLMPLTAALTAMGTNTRGGQIALAAQVLALTLTMKHRFKALLLVAVLGVVGYHLLPEEQKLRFEQAGTDPTSEQRLLYWKHGWQMMKDHPALGVGYFNFIPYYNQHHFDDLILPSLLRNRSAELPHNIFVQVGTDTGFIGLGIFLMLILGAFLTMRKLGREAAARGDPFVYNMSKGMNLALLGYVVAGQFVTVAYYPYLWIHLAFVAIMFHFWRTEQAHAVAAQHPAARVLAGNPGPETAPSRSFVRVVERHQG
jgi:putative inorganic carbon (hco3(-)) transporter